MLPSLGHLQMTRMRWVETTGFTPLPQMNICLTYYFACILTLYSLYSGAPWNPTTFLKSIQAYATQTTFAAGCKDVSCNSTDLFGEAIEAAKRADIVVVVAGLNLTEEREDFDRVSLLLPGKQMSLIHTIASVAKKPLVLVLLGGGPVDVSFAKQDPRIASILWLGYPGEVGGQVLPEILFGEYNPGE